jgi:hypothetical protein
MKRSLPRQAPDRHSDRHNIETQLRPCLNVSPVVANNLVANSSSGLNLFREPTHGNTFVNNLALYNAAVRKAPSTLFKSHCGSLEPILVNPQIW